MSDNIVHQIGSVLVGVRREDGYINATAMSKGYLEQTGQRRDVSEWLSNSRTKNTLQHLSSKTGIPVAALFTRVSGGTPDKQGTWIHPRLATRFAMWLSDDFGLMIEDWVAEWNQAKNTQNKYNFPEITIAQRKDRFKAIYNWHAEAARNGESVILGASDYVRMLNVLVFGVVNFNDDRNNATKLQQQCMGQFEQALMMMRLGSPNETFHNLYCSALRWLQKSVGNDYKIARVPDREQLGTHRPVHWKTKQAKEKKLADEQRIFHLLDSALDPNQPNKSISEQK